MKAKELRLGHYFNVPIKEQCPFRIDAFEHLSEDFIKVAMNMFVLGENVHPLTWHGGDLTPIPLTEEWHNAFGVERNGFDSFEYILPRTHNIAIKVIFNGDYVMLRQDDDIISIWNKDLTKRDMYVHEWQNLYFTITGIMLKRKEDESN